VEPLKRGKFANNKFFLAILSLVRGCPLYVVVSVLFLVQKQKEKLS